MLGYGVTQLRGTVGLVTGIFGAVFAFVAFMAHGLGITTWKSIVIPVVAIALTAAVYYGTGARGSRKQLVIAVISGGLAVISLVWAYAQSPSQANPPPKPAATGSAAGPPAGESAKTWLTPYAIQLKISPPQEPISHCISLTGTGTIPSGAALVLLSRPVNRSGNSPSSSTFHYDGVAKPTTTGWTTSTSDVGISRPKDRTEVLTLLVPQSAVHSIESGVGPHGDVPLTVTSLGAEGGHVVTTQNGQKASC